MIEIVHLITFKKNCVYNFMMNKSYMSYLKIFENCFNVIGI